MDLAVFIEIFTSWEVLVILVTLLVLFPVIFSIASLDKSPVKVKKVPAKKKAAEGKAAGSGGDDAGKDEGGGEDEEGEDEDA